MRKPSVTLSCPANAHSSPNERIVEFSFPDLRDSAGCPVGGLISLRTLNDGTPLVDVYRTDGAIRVLAPKEQPGPKPERRYLAVKLDAGLDTNGNGRRGWLVYLDTPESPILGWIEEEHGRADSDSMYELCSAILDAEGVEHMARTGAASYPHDVHALINSGRVRVLCSLSVPFAEVREARRTPFKLPATTAADPNIYEASWYSARIVVTPEHDSGSCTVDAAYLMGSWKGHEAATSAIRACAEYGTPGTWDTPRGVMMVRRA